MKNIDELIFNEEKKYFKSNVRNYTINVDIKYVKINVNYDK